ncbi:MAG TPA: hypothetical protein VD763_00395 [Candidatus Saccharimonadales bacterium]|nr:hypothetical protein [Candidatus Saccharimonadales bacterium]
MTGASITVVPRVRLRHRLAALSVLASASVNAVGVTSLIAMFVGFAIGERSTAMTLGRTNDILGLIGTALMVPAVFEIHALTGPDRRGLRTGVAVVGVGAMGAIIVLQSLLITERLTFEQQIGPVSVAYLAIAVWFIAGGRLASQAGIMPHGARLGAIAAVYVGQPWWAYRWGRRLLDLATDAPTHDRVDPVAGRPSVSG